MANKYKTKCRFNVESLATKTVPGTDKRELLEDLIFTDTRNTRVIARKGFKFDGASIPSALWSIVGHPWDNQYVKAAAIHDKECKVKAAKQKDVHRRFYEGLRNQGVGYFKAKTMYWAVISYNRVRNPGWK